MVAEYLMNELINEKDPDGENNTFVVIHDAGEYGTCCLGIYNSFNAAVGCAMTHIWIDEEDYKREPTDKYQYSPIYMMEGEGGYAIDVKYRTDGDKMFRKEKYMILFLTADRKERYGQN